MKQFWICVGISILIVIILVVWIAKASEKYLEDHPEIANQAKQSVDGYNEAVDRHNQKVASGELRND